MEKGCEKGGMGILVKREKLPEKDKVGYDDEILWRNNHEDQKLGRIVDTNKVL